MYNKGGLVVSKKEMTRLWIDGKMTPVTLVQVLPQTILRYKTADKDGYSAVVLKVGKRSIEFKVDDSFLNAHAVGTALDSTLLQGVDLVTVKGTTKGKGYQGAIKRFHLQGGPKTHGSKFHRHVGSMGNRKPRRTLKNHPHAGHMGDEAITLKKIVILDRINRGDEQLLTIKGSLPGARNGWLRFVIE